MRRWKQCLTMITAGALAVSLGACGKGTDEGKAAGEALTVSIWDNNQLPGLTEIMDDFTAISGVSVEVQVVPWDQYRTLLEAGAQGRKFFYYLWEPG